MFRVLAAFMLYETTADIRQAAINAKERKEMSDLGYPTPANLPEFLVIGHRGAAGLAPENSMAGFRLALSLGCPAIEIDVQQCAADANATPFERLFILHDSMLDRTVRGATGNIAELTKEQLSKTDAGDGAPIPSLFELLELLRTHRADSGRTTLLNIEIKGRGCGTLVAQALTNLEPTTQNSIYISSFSDRELSDFRSLNTDVPTAVLAGPQGLGHVARAHNHSCFCISLHFKSATKKLVHRLTSEGFRVFCYTVNDPEDAARLHDYGVSGVFSDRPDLMLG